VDLEHDFTVPMPVEEAWAAFNDLELIAPCFPGAVITSVDGDDFTGNAKIKLGPIALMYAGKGTWLERDEAARRVVIEANGKDKRGNGTAGALITAHLREEGEGTRVVVHTDLKITGRPAQFGRSVIQDVGSKILDQFASCLSTRLGGGEIGAAGAPAAAAAATTAAAPAEGPNGSATGPVAGVVPGPTVVEADGPAAGPSGEPAAAPREGARAAAGAATAGPSRSTAVPVSPAAATRRPPAEPAAAELDLGHVMGPVLLRRFGPLVAACAVTAVITWVIARRR
jgi:carbon monoxide dehydrogenase subunit G